MNEPFRRGNREEKVLDESGKPIPIFSASRFSICDWNHYATITPRLTKPITLELSEIFDLGNEVHRETEYLRKGARNILECEEYLRIVHESERWGIAGYLDYDMLCYNGVYIEDIKSTKFGGFFFFLKEGINKADKIQISIYGYMKYVISGTKRNRGVITKVDKDSPLNRISLVTDLFAIEKIRKFLLNHPVVLCTIGDIPEKKLIDVCTNKMRPEINKNTGEHWRCGNCQYADGSCPVRQAI